MIKTLSEFLLELKKNEERLLQKYSVIKHPGLIGDMYEGLSKHILQKSIFPRIDLRIEAGKIKNKAGDYSGEIDCMIVVGEGEKMPFTDKFIYNSNQVIAVIQVKKNLFSGDLLNSLKNLNSVVKITDLNEFEDYQVDLLWDAWRSICQEELPNRDKVEELSLHKRKLYQTLSLETCYPLRIVWGYNGFKKESSLRDSFLKHIENNMTKVNEKPILGFSPLDLPNLIICNNYSLYKINGMPYTSPLVKDDWWNFYVSSHDNPIYILLEIIWTRLSYMFKISSKVFGDNFYLDSANKLLEGKYINNNGTNGWAYRPIRSTEDILNRELDQKKWEPKYLDDVQYTIIARLCIEGKIEYENNIELIEFLEENDYTVEKIKESLKKTGLVDVTKGFFKLITRRCLCGVSPDGRFFAAENNSGQVDAWVKKTNDTKF